MSIHATLDNIEMRKNAILAQMTTELDAAEAALRNGRREDGLRHIAKFDTLKDEAITVAMETDFLNLTQEALT